MHHKIAVIGAGQMGNGIAQVAAAAGYEVVMRDIEQRFVDGGLKAISRNLRRMVDKGKLPAEEKAKIQGRIKGTLELKECYDAMVVVEAIIENAALKKQLFKELDQNCPPHTILASNTSSISITELAACTKRPDRFIGMHFMNPVPVMKLVEVIRGVATSDETAKTIVDLSRKMGKEPVEAQDFPGFIANRILMPMINEGCYALMEGGRVLVVRDDHLVEVSVETGLRNWQFTEVVRGLSLGDPVVVSLDRVEVVAGAKARITGETLK